MKAVQVHAHNVFQAISTNGSDGDFTPSVQENFSACNAPAGSSAKIAALRERLEMGQPLWHDQDRLDLVGLTETGRPRRRRRSRTEKLAVGKR